MSPDLAARVGRLEGHEHRGHAFRHIAASRDPLSGVGARLHGGRWNPPRSFETLYLGLDRETAIAELRRLAARQSLNVADLLPRRIYRFEVALGKVLDLTRPAARRAVGLSLGRMRSNDLTPCQQVGEAAHQAGFEAVLAPSAASDGVALAVFVDQLAADSVLTPLDFEDWEAG